MKTDSNAQPIRGRVRTLQAWCLRVAILSAATVLAVPAFGQTDVTHWRLEKDEQLKVNLKQTTTTKTKVDARETAVNSSNEIVMHWKVVSVTGDGDATIEQSLQSIKLSVEDPAVPSQAVRYDTALDDKEISKTSKTLLKQVKPLIGLKFVVVMSKLGEIKEVTLPPKTADAINQLPETLQLRKLFSSAGLKDILGASAIVLPEEKMAKGKQWADEKEVDTPFGPFKRIRNYQYDGRRTSDDVELGTFSIKSSMVRLSDSSQPNDPQKGKLVSFNGTGELKLDVKGGFFSQANIKNKVETERNYREKKISTVVISELETQTRKLDSK